MEAIVVAEESPQTFSCGYPSGNGGIPRPTLQWTKVGGTLSTDESERVHVKNGSVLFFSPIRESDEGIYTCTASNLAGEVTSDLEITVASEETFYGFYYLCQFCVSILLMQSHVTCLTPYWCRQPPGLTSPTTPCAFFSCFASLVESLKVLSGFLAHVKSTVHGNGRDAWNSFCYFKKAT